MDGKEMNLKYTLMGSLITICFFIVLFFCVSSSLPDNSSEIVQLKKELESQGKDMKKWVQLASMSQARVMTLENKVASYEIMQDSIFGGVKVVKGIVSMLPNDLDQRAYDNIYKITSILNSILSFKSKTFDK